MALQFGKGLVLRAAGLVGTVGLVASGMVAPASAAIRQEPTISLDSVTCEEGRARARVLIETNGVTGALTSVVDGNARGTTGLTGTVESTSWTVSLRDLPADKDVSLSFNLDGVPVAGATFAVTVPECADNAAEWPTLAFVAANCDLDTGRSLAIVDVDTQGAYGTFTSLVDGKPRETKQVTVRQRDWWLVGLGGFPAGRTVTIQFAVNGLVVPGWVQKVTIAACADNAAAVVKATTRSRASVLHVDVNPNKGRGFWRFRVERKKADGTWAAKGTYRTVGSKEQRTLNFKKGVYRVVVLPKYGYLGATSGEVTLKR